MSSKTADNSTLNFRGNFLILAPFPLDCPRIHQRSWGELAACWGHSNSDKFLTPSSSSVTVQSLDSQLSSSARNLQRSLRRSRSRLVSWKFSLLWILSPSSSHCFSRYRMTSNRYLYFVRLSSSYWECWSVLSYFILPRSISQLSYSLRTYNFPR